MAAVCFTSPVDVDRVEPAPGRRVPHGLGLVLSSGAARGAAHIGVMQVLEDAGIPVPVVVGTSSGALLGGAWAAGISADEIADRISRATWADFGSMWPNARLGLVNPAALRATLDEIFAGRSIEDLPRRFAAVATDARTRVPVLLDSGSATEAVCATIAVPGIYPPVRIGDRTLVDGVFTSPVPVWAARHLGASPVLAVTLRPANTSGPSPVRSRVVPLYPNRSPAELEILIDTSGYSSWSTRDVPALIELGRHAAENALDSIRDLLAPT